MQLNTLRLWILGHWQLATTCLLAMLPAWRGLPLRTYGVWDAALGYLIVAVAVGVVIHDINAPRSLGRAGRLCLAAAPILFLNCSTLNDVVALNALAFQFVANPMGLDPQFIRGCLIVMLALTYLFFMLRVAGGGTHGASAEDNATGRPAADPPDESDQRIDTQEAPKPPKKPRVRPRPQPQPQPDSAVPRGSDDPVNVHAPLIAPAATPASTTSQFFAFAWPAVLVVTVGILAWQTVQLERRDLQLVLCHTEAGMTAPKAGTIAPAPPRATDVEALSPPAQPKGIVETPATRPQSNRVGGPRRPP